MKKLVKAYNEKKAELQGLDSRLTELGKELSTFKTKLVSVKNDLLTAEVTEMELLRKTWSRQHVDQGIRQLEDGENARQANDCSPVNFVNELDLLRARIDEALKGIYPDAAVEAARTSTEELRRSTKTIETLIKKITLEIEDIDNSHIPIVKEELRKLELEVCGATFKAIKVDVDKIAWPLVRKAFIAAGIYNPYAYRWPSPFIFEALFDHKFPMTEILKERERMRAEIFGEKP